MESKHACASRNFAAPEAGPLSFSDRQSLAGRQNPMTDEQESRFAALQGAWLAMREKRRRPELATELDAAKRKLTLQSLKRFGSGKYAAIEETDVKQEQTNGRVAKDC